VLALLRAVLTLTVLGIYHYALYSPNGVIYSRSRARVQWSFEDPKRIPLFLVSRQVYYEALQIFFMENIVKIKYRPHLAGTLRLFPDKAARILQRIKIDYRPGAWHSLDRRRGFSGSWEQILTDSSHTKEFFPSLREFSAVWHVNYYDLNNAGLYFEGKSLQEGSELWAHFLRASHAEHKLVPSEWLKVEFAYEYNDRHKQWQVSFDEALRIFRKEVGGQEEDLEASGRKWLEEAFGDGKRINRRQRRQARLAGLAEP
jgi:hypothetical protein